MCTCKALQLQHRLCCNTMSNLQSVDGRHLGALHRPRPAGARLELTAPRAKALTRVGVLGTHPPSRAGALAHLLRRRRDSVCGCNGKMQKTWLPGSTDVVQWSHLQGAMRDWGHLFRIWLCIAQCIAGLQLPEVGCVDPLLAVPFLQSCTRIPDVLTSASGVPWAAQDGCVRGNSSHPSIS